jgi:hypothetical protein
VTLWPSDWKTQVTVPPVATWAVLGEKVWLVVAVTVAVAGAGLFGLLESEQAASAIARVANAAVRAFMDT